MSSVAEPSYSSPDFPERADFAAPRRLSLHDRYFCFLCFCLAGYAFFGKGFAYVGVPPLLIGEVMLGLGVIVLVRTGCWMVLFCSIPSILLLTLMIWVFCRTVVFLNIHGLDAIRDSVVVLYGMFAYIVIALLIERPERLKWAIGAYAMFAWCYGVFAPIILNINVMVGDSFPSWPGSGVPLVYVRLGEAAIHIAGSAVFVLLGFRQVSYVWLGFLFISLIVVTVSRGAMLSCMVPIAVAAILSGKIKLLTKPLLFGALALVAAYAANLEIVFPGGRSIGPQQLVNNVESIVGSSNASNLDGTKLWRLQWWNAIERYTIHGPYFWTGKGFGVNLSENDGFVVGVEGGGPPVRVPHNIHYTMLARSGVPGLTLWILLEVSWFVMLGRAILAARRRRDQEWARILLWIACYGLAIVVDASFDVAIEGPMVGIWYWSIFGFGIAATMISRAPNRVPPAEPAPA